MNHPEECKAPIKRKREVLSDISDRSVNIVVASISPFKRRKTTTLLELEGRRIQALVWKYIRSKNISDIHPSAVIRDDHIIIPSVSKETYKRAKLLLPAFIGTRNLRLDHSNGSTKKGTFCITMPTQIHEVLKAFASDIKSQMFERNPTTGVPFIPQTWNKDKVLETGSSSMFLQYEDKSIHSEPDASLGFSKDNPFLVLEVAVTQQPGLARRKIQDYILGSRGQIVFVVLIVVERQNPQRATLPVLSPSQPMRETIPEESSKDLSNSICEGAGQPAEPRQLRNSSSPISTLTSCPSNLSVPSAFQEGSSRKEQNQQIRDNGNDLQGHLHALLGKKDALCVGDTVYVSVYKSVRIATPKPDDPYHTSHSGQCLIDHVEVYPRRTAATFSIAWTDIASSAPKGAGPPLEVGFESLSNLATRLAEDEVIEDEDDGFRELPRVIEDQKIFLSSSSQEVDHEPSGGTMPSDVEEALDPDYATT